MDRPLQLVQPPQNEHSNQLSSSALQSLNPLEVSLYQNTNIRYMTPIVIDRSICQIPLDKI